MGLRGLNRLGRRAVVLVVALGALGCSVTAGGWSVCILDHTDLQLTIAHEHTDPNAN